MGNDETSKKDILMNLLLMKPTRNWRESMSRSQKAYHNKWNVETAPYIPTPKITKKVQ